MDASKRAAASQLVRVWANWADAQPHPESAPSLKALQLIAPYARHLEEEVGRLQIENAGYYEGAFKTKADLEPGWWIRIGKFFRLTP